MSSAPPLSLKLLNSMNRTGFATALGFAFELSPWVVERAWSERPFASVEALHAAMMDVLGAASVEDKLALIRAHPELASKAAIAKQLTAESNAEQASAGLDRLTPEEFARFHDLNAAYSERFGFPFIICVRLNDKASILAAMQARLAHDETQEIAEAIAQIGLISKLRLLDAVTD
ncbi:MULTISPECIES: 2-oxo-4-hydroxy-4-carboxy-5-ureidoimidazoline decarboxylase [Caulobacter]|jgi:2-oxo-4-hydroxy-4-carboxy-5-ureidoimidazoline decarboxylase|uniref:2-oxo-4-hydroxy-4-carboxy-5-ureidoimidazoline decarboxylase n=1 Tax=Caulobacter vibrioides OR37 TaxID=1292034 RepID=R0CVQ4_CAUVI|nr:MULTISPECIES: 2-oxo-4-hydroxy-4-carboxy-5-ureidoimidazoline decarboxylase [Caulobacter]ENZ80440.1 OHCU decarboxylase [Caulobacter vibrioides OR37]MBQ1563607.1 2-oxo-4-hydroxy-4-carboxy-5-ureidoimidazoline decarboxylase [Caulobacter sp.]